MRIADVFETITISFEVLGVIAMVVGFGIAVVLALRTLGRREGGRAAYLVLRSTIGASILLGLEVLVAADLIRTISSVPSLEEVAVLAVIVLIRTVLSMSLQIEIDGVVPWKRALLTSGGQLLAGSVSRETRATRAAQSTP
ncbi:DUF1622 domain-containing protein [Leucobacter weissii]|uniref:DUF1622 domain-containing protein n=1 Tax=Leucobacter weissii TaxID=1983706 RepID=A0A939S9H4_9MICO|nr:DUF1622 domain-containing protein [Leucobacter weissii]MBO1900927.1 DUF1622 domain-containing protein [Leucobacter weissii]